MLFLCHVNCFAHKISYITDADSQCAWELLSTASQLQILFLRDFIFNYHDFRAFLGIRIPVRFSLLRALLRSCSIVSSPFDIPSPLCFFSTFLLTGYIYLHIWSGESMLSYTWVWLVYCEYTKLSKGILNRDKCTWGIFGQGHENVLRQHCLHTVPAW